MSYNDPESGEDSEGILIWILLVIMYFYALFTKS